MFIKDKFVLRMNQPIMPNLVLKFHLSQAIIYQPFFQKTAKCLVLA